MDSERATEIRRELQRLIVDDLALQKTRRDLLDDTDRLLNEMWVGLAVSDLTNDDTDLLAVAEALKPWINETG